MKQGWEIKKLGEVFDLQMGKTPSRDNGDYWGGHNVWVAISDLQDKYIGASKEHITDKALTETKIKKVKAGTTIMSFKLSVGRAAITTQDLYTNEAIMAFNLNEGYDLIADYIYYYLKGYKWQGANKAVMGLTLNKASISQNHIAIPPREEQERIVAELDCLSGVIERKREQLRELDALAQSIFYQMFGDPITNEKGWEVKKLGEVCIINPQKKEAATIVDNTDEVSFLPMEDLSIKACYIQPKQSRIFSEVQSSYTYFKNGDVLLAKVSPCFENGKIGIAQNLINGVGFGSSEYIVFRLNTSILKEYLYFFLQDATFVEEATKNLTGTSGLRRVPKSFVENRVIGIPPLTLQQEFADKIEAIEKQKELIKKSISETETLFNARMDYYFN